MVEIEVQMFNFTLTQLFRLTAVYGRITDKIQMNYKVFLDFY